MAKKVLLVNPWICDFAAYDLWMFPLGLINIFTALKSDPRLNFKLLNCLQRSGGTPPGKKDNSSTAEFGTGHFAKTGIEVPEAVKTVQRKFFRYGISPEEAELALKGFCPDLILMTSGMTYWYPGVFETVKFLKTRFPGTPLVLGGTYAALCPEHARRYSGTDVVFSGRGLPDTLALINRFLPGIGESSSPEDVFPDFSLLEDKSALPVLGGFGCPFRCTYCASRVIYPGFRRKDPVRLAEHIISCARKFQTRDFAFYDDALFYDPEQFIKPLLKRIIRAKITARFHTPNGLHARFIDTELAELMYEAGFRTIRLSLESTRGYLQDKSRKKVSNQELALAVGILKKSGFTKRHIGVYTMLGFPGQTVRQIEEDIAFVYEIGAQISLSSFSLVPQTEEWHRHLKQGIITPNTDLLKLSHTAYSLLFGGFKDYQLRALRRKAAECNKENV